MLFTSLRNPSFSQSKKYSRRMLFWLLGIVLVLTATHIGLQYLNWEVYNEKNGAIYELANRFDFDDEASVMTWIAQFQFLLLSMVCLLASMLEKHKVLRTLWLVPAGVALLFSIDETATLHEFILQRIHVAFFQDAKPTLLSNSWVIVLPLIIVIAVLLARTMLKYLPRRTIGLMSIGAVVFISGAVVVDLITSSTMESPFIAQGIFVAIEESFELIGVALTIYAVTSYVEQVYGQKVGKVIKELKS